MELEQWSTQCPSSYRKKVPRALARPVELIIILTTCLLGQEAGCLLDIDCPSKITLDLLWGCQLWSLSSFRFSFMFDIFSRKMMSMIMMVDDYERITTLRLRLFDSALSLVLPLSQRLSSLGVPVDYWHDPLLPEISNFGKLMAVDSRNSNFMILQMGIEIEMLTFQQRNEDLDAAMARAVTRMEDPLSAEPAYRSDLENFRVQKEDLCLIPECVICLDKPSVFQKVSRLPCSHVFHWDCIVKWLINKKKCPMCRLRVRL